jgi:hypothetical protein
VTEEQAGFGRPGRRASIARELQEAFARKGIELLPGRARQMLDERIAEVAAQLRMSERTAMQYLPSDWAEQMAADVELEREQAQVAEQTATGTADVPVAKLGALMAGLAVVVQNAVWRAMGEALPVAVGEPLDCLSGLALALQSVTTEVEVPRAGLVAAARHVGTESDALSRGYASPDSDAELIARVIARLADDAAWARAAAR